MMVTNYPFSLTDGEQLPDVSVFDDLSEDLISGSLETDLKARIIKEEVKSPASCDNQSVFSFYSACSPYSPSAISEASSHDYSTDEGFQSDFDG